jgi:hypothetical protein
MGENTLFTQTMPDLIQLQSVVLLQRKQAAAHRSPTVLAWSRTITVLSPRICQVLFGRNGVSIVRSLLEAIPEVVAATPERPCRACLTTRWRDSNGILRTMITTIHALNIG